MVKDTTLYDRLEVLPSADENEIKKAYNRLSKKWHPDKNIDNQEEANQKFQEITLAKEVLLDSEKRDLYNNVGMDMFNNNGGVQEGNPFGDFSHFFNFPFGGFNVNRQQREEEQVEDLVQVLNCKLEDIYNEKIIKYSYKYKHTCSTCSGTGVKSGIDPKCKGCDGKGMKVQVVRMGPMIQQLVNTCDMCGGSGNSITNENKCLDCNGSKFIYKERNIDIPLKSGLVSTNKIVLSGKGHNINNRKSDLVLIINVLPHPFFKRSNKENSNDLFIDMELTLYQALFGFEKSFTHLDGRTITVSTKSKTDFNTVRKVNNEGMKTINNNDNNNTVKGNLYIKFKFVLPNLTYLPNETKSQLKILFQDNSEPIDTNNCLELSNCNSGETELVNNLLLLISNEEKQAQQQQNNAHHQHRQQQHQQQHQCVQQ